MQALAPTAVAEFSMDETRQITQTWRAADWWAGQPTNTRLELPRSFRSGFANSLRQSAERTAKVGNPFPLVHYPFPVTRSDKVLALLPLRATDRC